jgi:hypothetical protein
MKYMKFTTLALIILFFFVLKGTTQDELPKRVSSEIGFGVNYSRLGAGDYNGLMNEISYRKYFKYSGVDFSMNYAQSFSRGIKSEFYGFFDSGYSTTLIYSRINYFIVPINVDKVSFDIGVGLLGGYASNISLGYYDEKYGYPFYVSRYECGWEVGYNLKLNVSYCLSKTIEISGTAGFDVLGNMYSNAYLGLKVSYKIIEN